MEKEKFFKFTYQSGQPVRNHGKVVLLDKYRNWGLINAQEYIIENPELLELERCIIIKNGSILRVGDILPIYALSSGAHVLDGCKIAFNVRRAVVYRGEVISSEIDYVNFTFGQTGGEEFYDLLPQEAQQQVDDFRVYMTWVRDSQLIVLDGTADFLAHRAFRLMSETGSLKVRETGLGSAEYPKEVSVLKLQTHVYQPVFQEGFVPAVVEESREVTHTLETFTLEESGLPFSFKPVWKSPPLMVGYLIVNGVEIEGLVNRPGDGTGSYLDAVMYLGLMEIPPATLSDNDLAWLDTGGRICWVYQFPDYGFTKDFTKELTRKLTNPPSDPSGWVKVNAVYDDGNGSVRYIQENFNHQGYIKLVEDVKADTIQRNLVPSFNSDISVELNFPTEYPFSTGCKVNPLGDIYRNKIQNFTIEIIKGLNLDNFMTRVKKVKTKAQEVKKDLCIQHEIAQALIAKTEENFEKSRSEIVLELVQEEVKKIYNHISETKNALQKAEFVEVDKHCHEVEIMIAGLKDFSDTRGRERDELMKISNVQSYFGEDTESVERKEESYNNNFSVLNNPMQEALRKAGLI